jgi:ATP-dependent RNA circularization protein (DNA/RNA ligase family)|tara:strand:- start:1284 stop:1505 length:222 start_codon:yes stop_codon:yes gene_type:complete
MGLLKIEGHSDVMKDTETGAVININSNEIENARKRKAIRRQEKEEIENLKNEVSDIKKMLGTIIEKLDGSNNN